MHAFFESTVFENALDVLRTTKCSFVDEVKKFPVLEVSFMLVKELFAIRR